MCNVQYRIHKTLLYTIHTNVQNVLQARACLLAKVIALLLLTIDTLNCAKNPLEYGYTHD